MKCPYCDKNEGTISIASELGAVSICDECAREQQERLGILEEAFEVPCGFCGKAHRPTELKDELSKKEWAISRLCQECQDKVFGK